MSDKLHIAIKEEAINLQIGGGGAGVGGGGVAIQGSGTYIRDVGTVQFSNSNSMTFGLNTNGIMTASFSQSTHDHLYADATHIHGGLFTVSTAGSVLTNSSASSGATYGIPAWITTAMASENTSVFQYTSNNSVITSAAFAASNSTVFAGVGTSGTNVTMTLNSNGLALSVDPPGAGVGGAALQGSGTYTQNSGTIEFANSNGVTFGLTENQMTASYSQSTHDHNYIEIANSSLLQHTSATSVITANAVNTSITSQWLTTAALSNHTHSQYVNTSVTSQWLTGYTESTHAFTQYVGLLTTGVTGFNATINSSQLQLSVVDGSIYFNDSNGVTFGISTSGSSTSITASVATNYQSTGAYLTTAAESDHGHTQYLTTAAFSDHTHSDLYIALANSTDYATSVLSGTFQTTGAYLTTAPGTGSTLTTTAGTDLAVTYNSNGLQIAYPPWITTYSPSAGVAIAAAGATITNSTVVFSNSNGVSFGGDGSTITAQIAGVGTVNFVDSNGITWGLSTTGASTTITASFGLIWRLYGNTVGTSSSAVSILNLSAGTNITLSGGSGGITILG